MHVQLNEIDVTPLDELTRIKSELETLDGRLQTMEARKADVAEPVYLRVRSDYEQRRASLEQEAAPLKAAARAQYARLHALLTQSEADHEAARLDREEIDFRHSLGEFDEAEYKQRIAAVEDQLGERATAREQALALRQRFVAAFRSEDELLPARDEMPAPPRGADSPLPRGADTPPPRGADTMPPRPPLPTASEAATRRMRPLDPEAVSAPAAPAADVGATQTMRVLKAGNEAPVRPDQTVVMRSARLLPQNAEAGKLTHTVGLRPLTLGSGESCDVRIPGAAAQHAQLKAGMTGFTLMDLGGGVRVNGIAIDQHLLRHDDVIEIGAARFAFRES